MSEKTKPDALEYARAIGKIECLLGLNPAYREELVALDEICDGVQGLVHRVEELEEAMDKKVEEKTNNLREQIKVMEEEVRLKNERLAAYEAEPQTGKVKP